MVSCWALHTDVQLKPAVPGLVLGSWGDTALGSTWRCWGREQGVLELCTFALTPLQCLRSVSCNKSSAEIGVLLPAQ